MFFENFLCLSYRSEQFHLLFHFSHDRFCARFQEFTRIKALALFVLASLDVLACSLSEYDLALCINVDLSYAEIDGFLDHVVRDACTAVKYERHIACLLLDRIQCLKA